MTAAQRLLLLGGGHAHVQVLESLRQERLAGAEVLLVTPFARQMYSGMVPGLVAGHYAADGCAIPLPPLADAAGVPLRIGAAVHLDPDARRVRLADGEVLGYDWLSIDTGAVMDRDRLPGAREHALFVRPIEDFVRRLDALWQRLASGPVDAPAEIVVVGGGAAGVELALALWFRCGPRSSAAPQGQRQVRVTLLTGGPPPLAGYTARVKRQIRAALAERGVRVLQQRCTAVQAHALLLDDGTRLHCDAAVLATGSEAPRWLADSGLWLNEAGFARTGASLQSVSHPQVFATGDAAVRSDAPHPRSGVYAVRAGAPLAANLRRVVAGESPEPHCPPERTLNLISTGDRNAIASWGPLSLQGRWAWWWKDRIDRGFVERYTVDERAIATTDSA